MVLRRVGLVLAGCCTALAAHAQADPVAAARAAAANQLGLLEYCVDQGYADADSVSAQRNMLNRLPAGYAPTQAAEALGRSGILSVNGTETALAIFAANHATSEGAVCGQMADSAKHAAAVAQSAPAMPTMPTAPAGIPSVPGGVMPALPSVTGTTR